MVDDGPFRRAREDDDVKKRLHKSIHARAIHSSTLFGHFVRLVLTSEDTFLFVTNKNESRVFKISLSLQKVGELVWSSETIHCS